MKSPFLILIMEVSGWIYNVRGYGCTFSPKLSVRECWLGMEIFIFLFLFPMEGKMFYKIDKMKERKFKDIDQIRCLNRKNNWTSCEDEEIK